MIEHMLIDNPKVAQSTEHYSDPEFEKREREMLGEKRPDDPLDQVIDIPELKES